jgi:hypothetical protein
MSGEVRVKMIMCLKILLGKLFKPTKPEVVEQPKLTRKRIAQHEAAHGIVWYLFKDNWKVNSLTIERNGLPDDRMNGVIHISPNFNETENSIERANELFAIALAGLIGQNINLLLQRPNLLIEITQVNHFNQILDETGCGGDYEIARMYLPQLGQAFQTSEGAFTKYKILDLITLFQDNKKVLEIHSMLTQLLLDNGTLNREELISFFEGQSFQEYIEDENLDINFFHRS